MTDAVVRRIADLDRVPGPPDERPEAAAAEPQRAKVALEFQPSNEKQRAQLRRVVGEGLPGRALDELERAEDKVLAWAARSNTNAARLVADPVAALRESGAEVAPETLNQLAAYRDRLIASVGLGDLSALGELRVSAKRPPPARPPQRARRSTQRRKKGES